MTAPGAHSASIQGARVRARVCRRVEEAHDRAHSEKTRRAADTATPAARPERHLRWDTEHDQAGTPGIWKNGAPNEGYADISWAHAATDPLMRMCLRWQPFECEGEERRTLVTGDGVHVRMDDAEVAILRKHNGQASVREGQ